MSDHLPQIFTPPTLLDGARWKGMRVGLIGGSFNPPHEGHIHISLIAMQTLKLDCIWWVVTPQNPFKNASDTIPFEYRLRMCEEFIWHPRIIVTRLEKDLGFTRSINTVREFKKRFSATSFAWITGMDVAHQLHRWYRWRDLLDEIAMVHICRPPAYSVITNTPVRLLGGRRHVYPETAARYPLKPGLSYWILQKKMIDISSTNLRRQKLHAGSGNKK